MENPGRTQSGIFTRVDKATHRGRILGVHICDRINLSVGSSNVKMCFQEGLDVSIGTSKGGLKSHGQTIIREMTHVIDWLYREKRLET